MEGLTAREWFQLSLQIVTPLLLALSAWGGRKSLMRPPTRYIYVLFLLGYIILDAYEVFLATHTPLALRVIRLLSLAVLAITVLLAWSREKT